jgi:endonuclease/exonuclease/phosphatase (EEP) superfamily protein YafD
MATAAGPRAGVPLKIASANVLFLNDEHADVIAWARRVRPEVLLFLETTAEWRSALAPLAAEYPHSRYVTDRDHHGLLLLSRWPLSDVVTEAPGGRLTRPVIFATITKDGAPLRLAAMHATWPMRPRDARQRAFDLAALAAEAARRGPLPFVGIGDLNTSPFSPYYEQLLRAGGLRSAATGHGWEPTWPSLFLPFGIQIDHALVSPEIEVRGFNRGPPNGSDHMPIIVEVTIPRK